MPVFIIKASVPQTENIIPGISQEYDKLKSFISYFLLQVGVTHRFHEISC